MAKLFYNYIQELKLDLHIGTQGSLCYIHVYINYIQLIIMRMDPGGNSLASMHMYGVCMCEH